MILAAVLACWAGLSGAAEPRVTVRSRGPAPGEAVLIVVEGQPNGKVPRGSLAGQPLRFWRGRRDVFLALGGFDLDVATGPARLELELAGDGGLPHYWSSVVVVEPKAFPTRQLKVQERFVTLAKADEKRSEAEARRLQLLFAQEGREPLFSDKFKSPIPGALSSRFGERRVFNDVPKNPHSGADLKAKKGEPVGAAARGRVVLAESLFYSGKSVLLDHGLGLYTFYGHLSKIEVAPGQLVKPGQRIGRVGATGRATGPHLHWAAKLHGVRVDPFSLIALPLDGY